MSELQQASRLWKEGLSEKEIAEKVGRTLGSLKNQTRSRRDLFPRRYQFRGDLKDAVMMKFELTPYVYKLVKEEAQSRGISINMVVRETLRDRFVRKLWKPQESTSTAKVPYFNGSRG